MKLRTQCWVVVPAVCCLLGSLALARPQFGSLSGPTWGVIFDDAAGGLRPLLGIPGSATLGPPLDLGYVMSRSFALSARYSLVAAEGTKELLVLDLWANSPLAAIIPGVPSDCELAAVSEAGTAIAFYRRGSSGIWIVTGLPLTPVSQFVEVFTDVSVKNVVVSNDGKLLVYSASSDDGDRLYAWTAASNTSRVVTSAASISGLALMKGHAIVADKAAEEIFAVLDVADGAFRLHLADGRNGISQPSGLIVSPDDQIQVLNKGTAEVLTLNLFGSVLRAFRCACILSSFVRVGDSTFLVSRMDAPTLFIFDTSAVEEQLMFVPKAEVTP